MKMLLALATLAIAFATGQPASAQSADTLARIKESRTFRIGYIPSAVPLDSSMVAARKAPSLASIGTVSPASTSSARR